MTSSGYHRFFRETYICAKPNEFVTRPGTLILFATNCPVEQRRPDVFVLAAKKIRFCKHGPAKSSYAPRPAESTRTANTQRAQRVFIRDISFHFERTGRWYLRNTDEHAICLYFFFYYFPLPCVSDEHGRSPWTRRTRSEAGHVDASGAASRIVYPRPVIRKDCNDLYYTTRISWHSTRFCELIVRTYPCGGGHRSKRPGNVSSSWVDDIGTRRFTISEREFLERIRRRVRE